jgi:hypothetical protein
MYLTFSVQEYGFISFLKYIYFFKESESACLLPEEKKDNFG